MINVSEHYIPRRSVIRSSIYPTVNNDYEKLVLEGENIVWGNIYGRVVEVNPKTLVLGSIYADKLVIKGPAVINGSIAGSEAELERVFVNNNIITTDKLVVVDSYISGHAVSGRIILNGSITSGIIYAHHKEETPYLEARTSMSRSIVSTGEMFLEEAALLAPIIYVGKKLEVSGRIILVKPERFTEIINELSTYTSRIINTKSLPESPPSTPTLLSRIEPVEQLTSEDLAGVKEEPGGFIYLITREVVFRESKKLSEYFDLLRDLL